MYWPLVEYGDELTNFLGGLTTAASARVRTWLEKLAEQGELLGRTKPLGKGLFELKVSHDGMAYRCLYMHYQGAIVFLVCFVKKKQRAVKEIQLARDRQRRVESQMMRPENVTLH